MGVPILWHLLKTFSHCRAAKTGEVFVAKFEALTPPAENAKMAPVSSQKLALRSSQGPGSCPFQNERFMNSPETNREEVIPAVATRDAISGMVAIKGQSGKLLEQFFP